MESPDLNASASDEARLDRFLRTTEVPLDDAGFSDRVLAALPPPVAERSPRRRQICLAAAAVGIAFAAVRIGGLAGWHDLTSTVDRQLAAVQAATGPALAQLPPGNLSLALGITALSLAYAFRSTLKARWSVYFG